MIPALLFVVQHALALALVVLLAGATGTAIAGARAPLALRSVLGLAIAGQLLVTLGAFGAIRPWGLFSLGAIAIAVAILRMGPPPSWRLGREHLVPVFALVGTALPLFALALYPPIAFDETLYHLPFIQAIADSGAIRFLPSLRFPAFPQLHEVLCVPGFMALGDVATHLVSVAEVVLLVALLASWLRGRACYLAAAVVLGSPIVVHHATITYVESALMLFVAAGFFCLDRASEEKYDSWWVAGAGFFLGTACSVKYLGGFFAIAGLAFVVSHRPNRPRRIAIFLGALLAAVVPTYALLIAFTGNPVFPFLPSLFGASPWVIPRTENAEPVLRALRLFWDLSFARELVNQQPPYSPFFALGVLITILAARRDRRAALLSVLVVVYIALFVAILPRDSRYLMPFVPLASIALARGMAQRKRLAIALTVLSIVAGGSYVLYRINLLGLPPTERVGREQFLERRIPQYRAFRHRGPGRIYVCGAEQLQYFGRGELMGDWVGPSNFPQIFGGRDAAGVAGALASLDVRYLLVSRQGCPEDWRRVPAPPFLERAYADAGAELWRVASLPLTNSR